MSKPIPSIHSKSHEDRAHHGGRSGGRSALARALDPRSVIGDTRGDYPGSNIHTGERATVDMSDDETPMDFTKYNDAYSYDEAYGPRDMTRRVPTAEWAPTEYEQLQNRLEADAVLDAVTKAFKK